MFTKGWWNMDQDFYYSSAADELVEDIKNMIVQYQQEVEKEKMIAEKESILGGFLSRASYGDLTFDMFGLCEEDSSCPISKHEVKAGDLQKKIALLKSLKDDIEREKSYKGTMYAAE